MLKQDGCVPGYDVAHIKSFGADPRNDVLENLICACRLHHQRHENGLISDIEMQMALYHFYGYGPDEWLTIILNKAGDIARDDFGFWLEFDCDGETIEFIVRTGVGYFAGFQLKLEWLDGAKEDLVLSVVRNEFERLRALWQQSP